MPIVTFTDLPFVHYNSSTVHLNAEVCEMRYNLREVVSKWVSKSLKHRKNLNAETQKINTEKLHKFKQTLINKRTLENL